MCGQMGCSVVYFVHEREVELCNGNLAAHLGRPFKAISPARYKCSVPVVMATTTRV